jgi:2-polyprenyl-3-methyl-5-hydroxy-6-metoxy-1,4-benzoquinol methylase
MFEFHKDKSVYFQWQTDVTKNAVIPFVESYLSDTRPLRVLEIGCGEAGVLKAFLDQGHYGCGVELSQDRVDIAVRNLQSYIDKGQASIITKNIYDIDPAKEWERKFDLIVLKDVIEHIPDQEKFIPTLKNFLNPDGVVFFAYPPWYMPFGGHQQLAKSKFLSKLPWFHLLPMTVYKGVLKMFGESEGTIGVLEEIKDTGISIERLKRIVKSSGYSILKEKYWLVNPIYAFKFKLGQRTVISPFKNIPFLRNIYTTAHYIAFKVK